MSISGKITQTANNDEKKAFVAKRLDFVTKM